MKSTQTIGSEAVGPHAHERVLTAGPKPEEADGTIVLVHGRGASAESILSLYEEFDVKNFAAVAPQAADQTWYPYSFLSPLEANQPYLDSALSRVEAIIADLLKRGVPSEMIALLGFSQGACLVAESVARHPRRYGAVLCLTGGLIGPVETPRNYPGSLAGTPIFLGTSDPDPHVPIERAIQTRDVLTRMGADVELRRYPGMAHTINRDEIEACRASLLAITGR